MEELKKIKEILKKEVALKPWMKKLIGWGELGGHDLEQTRIQLIWNLGIGDEKTFKDILRLRGFIIELHPNPIVYYIGIGNIERLNFDIIHPLLATDFSKLIAVDIGPREHKLSSNLYEKFIQAVVINLSFIDDLDLEKLSFSKIGETEFKTEFFYGKSGATEKRREIHFFCRFDGRDAYPEELKKGYNIFFSRLTRNLFGRDSVRGLKNEIKNEILELLIPKGFFILEEYHTVASVKLRRRMLRHYLGKNFIFLPFDFCSKENPENLEQRVICFMKKG